MWAQFVMHNDATFVKSIVQYYVFKYDYNQYGSCVDCFFV